ncbi:DNA-directed RNA polymerase sigma-70 factor [Dietzia sp. NCCP-2495]|uniref:RNA polymerase sigma factor n=1 Tax=Dietzia sp. NCCP-2495 TaxID=2934675 RepID=UPI00222FE01D|nr:DUF6596 domain-containing protein [Dietzia sp. NCCP-2495]GLB62754.1 DNA-directed RNA polymerase sigma-70 factor [Dietzia sp. NCCP-2495]
MEDSLHSGVIDRVVRDARPRLIALLAAPDGDLAASEDAFSDAVERALRTWPDSGVPRDPEAWLFTVARNRRRDRWRGERHTTAIDEDHPDSTAGERSGGFSTPVEDSALTIPDHRLALLAVAAHPEVEPAARTPLMLNAILGLSAEKIGALLLVPTAIMAARLTRARKRIAAADIPFETPGIDELPSRLESIRAAIYGAYAVDWTFSAQSARDGLAGEALYLAELLCELVENDPESHGLAALLCLASARAGARVDAHGDFVPLERQDTRLWDAALLERGEEHLRSAGTATVPGPYRLQAAIQALHCARRHTGVTDWESIRRLHAGLQSLSPTAGGAVALAVATARCDGPEAGLELLDGLRQRADRFQPALAARAAMLEEASRTGEAASAYDRAISLTTDPAARRYLEQARSRCHPATAEPAPGSDS